MNRDHSTETGEMQSFVLLTCALTVCFTSALADAGCADASPSNVCQEMKAFCGSTQFGRVAKLACASTCGACQPDNNNVPSMTLEYCDEEEEFFYSRDTGKCYTIVSLSMRVFDR